VASSEASIARSYPHVKFDGEDLGHNGPSMVVDACVIASGVARHTELAQTTNDEVVHVVSGLEPGDVC
jgi:hypothetical protein